MKTNKNLDELLCARELLQEKVNSKERELAELNAELTLLDKKLIPELMEDLGITGCTACNGKRYKIITNYFPKIIDVSAFAKSALKDEALKSKIKVVYTLPPKELDVNSEIKQTIFEKFGVILEDSVSVHPQTLKAYVRNLIDNNLQLPEGLSVYSERKITTK